MRERELEKRGEYVRYGWLLCGAFGVWIFLGKESEIWELFIVLLLLLLIVEVERAFLAVSL